MANSKGRRRRFGAIRQLPSGQWQARYRDPDRLMRSADTTFPTKTDAEVWLTCKEAEILNGGWINPDAGKVLLADYGTAWIRGAGQPPAEDHPVVSLPAPLPYTAALRLQDRPPLCRS